MFVFNHFIIFDIFYKNLFDRFGFIPNQTEKLMKKNYIILSKINKHYYLKFQILMCHRQFLRIISQNHEFVEHFCNNGNNFLAFSIR